MLFPTDGANVVAGLPPWLLFLPEMEIEQLEKTPSFLLQKDARANRPDTPFKV